MKIKSIVIELEPETPEEQDHAKVLEYRNNMWTVNGPVFTRIIGGMGDIIRLIKGR